MTRTAGLLFTCLSLLLVGCDSIQGAIYKDAILKVIREDALTGSDPTPGHAAAMRTIDLSECPSDFREAYIRHIQAWDLRAHVETARLTLEEDAGAAAVGGAIATLFDSAVTPFADHMRAMERNRQDSTNASAQISSTWSDVETVAAKYGAQLRR